jgi:hypothetical protein
VVCQQEGELIMQAVIKLMGRFNEWYDSLKEPYRFLFCMVVLMGWIFPIQSTNEVLCDIGVTWMLTTCALATSRVWR